MDADDRRKHEREMQDYWDEKVKRLPPWPLPETSGMCAESNHRPCTGRAWDRVANSWVECDCWCHEKAAA